MRLSVLESSGSNFQGLRRLPRASPLKTAERWGGLAAWLVDWVWLKPHAGLGCGPVSSSSPARPAAGDSYESSLPAEPHHQPPATVVKHDAARRAAAWKGLEGVSESQHFCLNERGERGGRSSSHWRTAAVSSTDHPSTWPERAVAQGRLWPRWPNCPVRNWRLR